MNRATAIPFGLLAGIVFWVGPYAKAQQRDQRVSVSVRVTDDKGHYVNGLRPKDFRILEDGILQELDSFKRRTILTRSLTYRRRIRTKGSVKSRYRLCLMSAASECAISGDTRRPKNQSSPLPNNTNHW